MSRPTSSNSTTSPCRMMDSIPASVPDSELDAYIANLILQQSNTQSQSYQQRGISACLQDDRARIPNTNKRFLANILRNVKGHNQAVLRQQIREAKLAETKRLDSSRAGSSEDTKNKLSGRLRGWSDDEPKSETRDDCPSWEEKDVEEKSNDTGPFQTSKAGKRERGDSERDENDRDRRSRRRRDEDKHKGQDPRRHNERDQDRKSHTEKESDRNSGKDRVRDRDDDRSRKRTRSRVRRHSSSNHAKDGSDMEPSSHSKSIRRPRRSRSNSIDSGSSLVSKTDDKRHRDDMNSSSSTKSRSDRHRHRKESSHRSKNKHGKAKKSSASPEPGPMPPLPKRPIREWDLGKDPSL